MKMFVSSFILFCSYCAYILAQWPETIAPMWRGTVLDPLTFMSGAEWQTVQTYRLGLYLLFGAAFIAKIVLYVYVWRSSLPQRHSLVVLMSLVLASALYFLPLHLLKQQWYRLFRITTETWAVFWREWVIDLLGELLLLGVLALLVLLLLRRGKALFVPLSLLLVTFTISYTYVYPLFVAPLYDRIVPMENVALERQLLRVAERAGVQVERIYEVKMAHKTSAMNAYVAGFGNETRIAIWDTTIQQLSRAQLLYVFAHELAHYKARDVLRSLCWQSGAIVVALAVATTIARRVSRTPLQQVVRMYILYQLVIVLLTPLLLQQSVRQELTADRQAVVWTGDQQAARDTLQQLAKQSKQEWRPPELIYRLTYSHPSFEQRMRALLP